MMKYLDLKRINEPYVQAADEVLQSGWYLRGEATQRFEQHYAEYIGTKHCIGCANGLDALTLILRAYKEMGIIKGGDEIIVPANTYIASILSVTENQLVPVLVEPDINTLQIDDSLIEQAITSRTRAIMIVHLYGRCAYTDRIGELCNKYGLKLIEDNAQAHGCITTTIPDVSPSDKPVPLAMQQPTASIPRRTWALLVMQALSLLMMMNWLPLSVLWVTTALPVTMSSITSVAIHELMSFRQPSLMLS